MRTLVLSFIFILCASQSESQVLIMPARTIISQVGSQSSGTFNAMASQFTIQMDLHAAYATCCDFPELNNYYEHQSQLMQYKIFANFNDQIEFYDTSKHNQFDEEALYDIVREQSIKYDAEQALITNKRYKQTGKEIGAISRKIFEEYQIEYLVYTTVLAVHAPNDRYDDQETVFYGSLSAYAWIVDCRSGKILKQAHVRPRSSIFSRTPSVLLYKVDERIFKNYNNTMMARIRYKLNRYL